MTNKDGCSFAKDDAAFFSMWKALQHSYNLVEIPNRLADLGRLLVSKASTFEARNLRL